MSRVVVLPPAGPQLSQGIVPGGWWRDSDQEGRIVCDLCPRACQLKPGDRGFCFVRQNHDGQMVLTTYGKSTGFCIDPIEKKPLNHFLPGTSVLSFGTAGCNLGCKFCQNWDISKSREVERLSESAMPETIAEAARRMECRSVAYTYNDPVIWAEYAIDTARACRSAGVKNVAVTAGYICPEARGPFFEFMDAANIDLKAFSEEFYWGMTNSHMQPVLDTLRWLKQETDVWFEITNLLIPAANDDPDEIRRMCQWILDHLGNEVPVHFTAFHPDFRLKDRPPTPHETLLAAQEIGRQIGLNYVYVGNVDDDRNQSTYCPGCGEVVIQRNWYELGKYALENNRCKNCRAELSGVFEQQPGNWGRKRLPVRISEFAPETVSIEPPAPSPPKSPPSIQAKTEMSPIADLDQLSPEQETIIFDAACRTLLDSVWRRDVELPDPNLSGMDHWIVMGVFVTVKQNGRLRGCCGVLGQPLPLKTALTRSASRTAVEDARFPPISPTELPNSHIDVTLLSDFQAVTIEPGRRAEVIEVGRHGVSIRRGSQSGLLLPSVASDNGWDAEQFLRQLCRKAGLPVTAWQDADTELKTFEGHVIEAKFPAEKFEGSEFRTAGPYPLDQLRRLAGHCNRNIHAMLSGAATEFYVPDCPDGSVSAAALSVKDAEGNVLGSYFKRALHSGVPLQATLYHLCEWAARSAEIRVPGWFVELLVMSDVAMHGSANAPDLEGIRSNRVIAVHQQERSAWVFVPDLTPQARLEKALEACRPTNLAQASVFSLAATATADEMVVSEQPRAVTGSHVRPAAVANVFYPQDPAKLHELVEELTIEPPAQRNWWPAAMVPHAGLRYSGRLAAQVLQHLEIPGSVIVIGPKHTRDGLELAVAPNQVWEIPGAQIPSDMSLAEQIVEAVPLLEFDAGAHRNEHAIEVELPLLQHLSPGVSVVGIALGTGNLQTCQTIAEGLSQVIRALDTPPLLLISSDMNHFATDVETRRVDEIAMQALESLDPVKVFETVVGNGITMCGVLPAVTVLETLRQLGTLSKSQRVGYATSGDVSGDLSRVVGYAGMLFG